MNVAVWAMQRGAGEKTASKCCLGIRRVRHGRHRRSDGGHQNAKISMMGLKRGVKRLRRQPALNTALTLSVRAAVRARGREWAWAAAHLPRVGTVTARLPNGKKLRLVTDGTDWVANQIFWGGWSGFEPDVSPTFFELARSARVVLDIGAHIGFYSCLAALANPDARVFGFEPMPGPLEVFRANVAANDLSTVEIVTAAAGATTGRAEFYFQEGPRVPSSSSLSREFMSDMPQLASREVAVMALDEFVETLALQVDLVKIDTESTESEVLDGLARTLRRDKPHVIVEVLDVASARPDRVDELCLPLGYRPILMSLNGPIERRTVAGAAGNFHLMPP